MRLAVSFFLICVALYFAASSGSHSRAGGHEDLELAGKTAVAAVVCALASLAVASWL